MYEKQGSLKDLIRKIIITALVLAITAFITPAFRISGLWTLLVAAGFIAIIDFLLQSFTNIRGSAAKRGFVGFVVTVVILLLTDKLIAGFNISTLASIVASIIIAIVDVIIPGGAI